MISSLSVVASRYVVFADPDTPRKLVISDTEQSSVTLSWRPGASQVINRMSVVYRKSSENTWQLLNVTSSSLDEVRRTRRSASAERRVFVLDGLEPDTDYVVFVEVESFGKISRSPQATFKTRELCRLICSLYRAYKASRKIYEF